MEAVLDAQARDTFGKNEARRTRRGGQVPGVLYGGDGKAATPISVAPKALLKILHSESGQNTLISLKLAGAGDNRVLVKDFQLDPVTHDVLHVDFGITAMRLNTDTQHMGYVLRQGETDVPAGIKRADALFVAGPNPFSNTTQTGYTVGVSVPLPFFNNGRYEVARYQAEQEQAGARLAVLARQIRAEIEGARDLLAKG